MSRITFSTHPYSGAAEYISTKAHELHAAGVAQDFPITGSSSTQSVTGQVNHMRVLLGVLAILLASCGLTDDKTVNEEISPA